MKIKLLIIAVLAFLLLLRVPVLLTAFTTNLGMVFLNKAIWQDGQTAVQRQEALAPAAYLLSLSPASQEYTAISDVPELQRMIPALYIAEFYRRQGKPAQAADVLYRAAAAPPQPPIQEAIRVPGVVGLARDGSLVLPGNSPIWQVRRDVIVETVLTHHPDGSSTLRFERHSTEFDRAVLAWDYPFAIPYHHTLYLKAKVEAGCNLSIETVIDGTIVRHPLAYGTGNTYHGTGDWDQLEITVEGRDLRFIYLLLDIATEREAERPDILTSCEMELEFVRFAPD